MVLLLQLLSYSCLFFVTLLAYILHLGHSFQPFLHLLELFSFLVFVVILVLGQYLLLHAELLQLMEVE